MAKKPNTVLFDIEKFENDLRKSIRSALAQMAKKGRVNKKKVVYLVSRRERKLKENQL